MTDAQRHILVEEARKLIGVPFQHAGRNQYGLDCIGLLVFATRNAGMEVYDNKSYSPIVNPDYMIEELAKGAELLSDDEPLRPGDVLLFRVGRSPQHVALVSEIGHGTAIIHSYQTVGKVVEQWIDVTWFNRLVSRWSWRPS